MTPPTRGRGLIIAGIVLVVVSVVLGTGSFVYFTSNTGIFDQEDVAIEGPTDRLVPGTIDFSVLEPLDGSGGSEMTVGIALSAVSTPEPLCSITGDGGEQVDLRDAGPQDELYDWDAQYSDYDLLWIARLAPGDYSATCETEGDAASSGVSFTVGRALSVDDMFEDVGSLFAGLGGMALAGLLFVIGVVLLIVGLVQHSRSKREPVAPGPWSGAPGPGPYGGAPGQYGQPAPYGQPGPPGQPGPYVQPGPYGQPPPGSYGQPAPYGQPVPPAPPGAAAPGAPQSPPPYVPPSGPPTDAPAPVEPPAEGSVGGWTVPPSKQ